MCGVWRYQRLVCLLLRPKYASSWFQLCVIVLEWYRKSITARLLPAETLQANQAPSTVFACTTVFIWSKSMNQVGINYASHPSHPSHHYHRLSLSLSLSVSHSLSDCLHVIIVLEDKANHTPVDFVTFVKAYARLSLLANDPAARSVCARRLAILVATYNAHLVHNHARDSLLVLKRCSDKRFCTVMAELGCSC
jgi:hypothetical protein